MNAEIRAGLRRLEAIIDRIIAEIENLEGDAVELQKAEDA